MGCGIGWERGLFLCQWKQGQGVGVGTISVFCNKARFEKAPHSKFVWSSLPHYLFSMIGQFSANAENGYKNENINT